MEAQTKTITTLTEDQQVLLKTNGIIINNGCEYYHLPQWYLKTEKPNVYEVLSPDQMPDDMKKTFKDVIFPTKETTHQFIVRRIKECEDTLEKLGNGNPESKKSKIYWGILQELHAYRRIIRMEDDTK